MTPRRKPRRGALAWLLDGVEPKQMVLVLASLVTALGGCWKAGQDVAGAREQVTQVENRSTWQRGHLRATVDSLRLEVLALKREIRRRPKVKMASYQGEWVGPPVPERRGTLVRSLFGWFKRGA